MADEPTDEQVRIVATAIAKAYEESCIVAECDMVAARAAIEAWRAVENGIPVYRLTSEDPT